MNQNGKKMAYNHQERVKQTLDFIQQDRIIPEDPWFYSRLLARMENEAEIDRKTTFIGSLALRFRPVLVSILVLIGIAGGIALGRALSPNGSALAGMEAPTASVLSPVEDANAAVFKEISSSLEEKILFIK